MQPKQTIEPTTNRNANSLAQPNPSAPTATPTERYRSIASPNAPLDPALIKIIVIFIAIAIFVLLGYLSLRQIFYQNPFGPEVRIDNFSQHYEDVPTTYRERIFNILYNVVSVNVSDIAIIPKSGAIIRDGTASYRYERQTDIHYGSGIIDIPELQQSYRLYFQWTKTDNNPYISSDDIVISCPEKQFLQYGDFNCQNVIDNTQGVDTSQLEDDPLIKYLPIDIDYYAKTGEYISYMITYSTETDKEGKLYNKIVIDDRSGDSYERALDRIRNLKCGDEACNPDDYTIEYNDYSW